MKEETSCGTFLLSPPPKVGGYRETTMSNTIFHTKHALNLINVVAIESQLTTKLQVMILLLLQVEEDYAL